MKWMSITLCLVISGCGGGATQTSSSTPAPVIDTPSPRTAVVFVGDSITAAWQLPADYTNAGIPGNRSADMLARFDAVLAKRPAIVAILAGTNDVRYGSTDTIAVARMAELAATSGACVVLGTIPPISDWLGDTVYTVDEGNARTARWNLDLRYLAQAYGYRLADYHAVLVTPEGNFDQSLFWDTVHPNAAGYAVMWPIVTNQINTCH